ncbi:coiled-coil domain-containing protein 22 [Amia ocellicauda]|uniref:coiled-coil domain-containing protein 22 n=1 Tax=Amia ocellicauda TaxID=2972642 RepID=UPI0034649603
MEEVDKILIHSLRQAGTEVGEDVQCVKQFSSELIVEAVVRCVRIIQPSLGSGLSHLLPPGMSARFRLGMSLAQACQDLGYKGEIGYQTFLYSNEPEIRSLLMFLVEKLPRESAESSDQPAGKSALLQRAIAAQIKAQLALPWVPPSCRVPLLCQTQGATPAHSFHAQPLSLPLSSRHPGKKTPKEVKEYYREYLTPVTAQVSQHASVLASLLERNVAELSTTQEWESEWNSQGLVSRLTPEEYKSRKRQRLQKRIQDQLRHAAQPRPDAQHVPRSGSDLAELLRTIGGGAEGRNVLAKGTRFTHTEKFTFTQEPEKAVQQMAAAAETLPSSRQSEQDLQQRQEEEVTSLRGQLEQLSLRIEEVGSDMKQLTVSIGQVSDELNQRELSNVEKEGSVRVKKQTIDLLPDAENNLSKLQVLVEGSAKRVVSLAAQWEKHRAPLIEEHRQLKQLCSSRELESSRRLSEIKGLHDKIRQSAEEAKKKEGLYKQLMTEFESLPKDVSRSAYTQRILEIVGNIKKQKEEITKILSDTKDLQKEINSLTGKLDRTFAVTDELVFKDAKKDESVRKAYKYLAALHENCTQLIQTIEDTGTIMREIRDLEEQIDTEDGKKTTSNLEKILEDYKAIRQENAALAAKIREA